MQKCASAVDQGWGMAIESISGGCSKRFHSPLLVLLSHARAGGQVGSPQRRMQVHFSSEPMSARI